jgi:hypothetical protein
MGLPAGTLFAAMHEPWVFGDLELKGDTFWHDRGDDGDFWTLQLAWPEADDTGMSLDRLDEMQEDSTVSYPLEPAYSRHGLFDDDRQYLVYEAADTAFLIGLLKAQP